MIRILPPKQGEMEALAKAANEDSHGLYYPTDVLWKDGKQVGFLSIAALPTVMTWLSTKEVRPRETVEIFNFVEAVVRRSALGVVIPIPKHSPVHPYVEKLGYTNGGNYDFFFKTF